MRNSVTPINTKKVTIVELEAANKDMGKSYKRSFPIEVANKLMKMPGQGGWRLPQNSKFSIGKNGIELKRDTEEVSESKERDNNPTGNKESVAG